MNNETRLSEKQFEAVLNKLDQLVKASKKVDSKDPKHIIFDNISLCELFKVSARTVQYWRYNNLIAYSQIGNKIFYRMDDVQAFLDKYYNPIKK